MAIDLERGVLVTPRVRQNFFRPAPEPFQIRARSRLLRITPATEGGGAVELPPEVLAPGGGGFGCRLNRAASLWMRSSDTGPTTVYRASARIPFPFVIRHVVFLSSNAFEVVTPTSLGMFVAPNPPVSATTAPPGRINISLGLGFSAEPQIHTVPQEIYPNFLVRDKDWVIVIEHDVTEAVEIKSQAVFDIEEYFE